MQTIKVPAEFTGYIIVRHKKCGAAVRINVGPYFLRGYAPDGKHSKYDWKYEGCNVENLLPNTTTYKKLLTTCKCGALLNVDFGTPVYGSYKEEVVCNAKCMGAVGRNCECSCGGMNHGGQFGN